MKIAVPYENGNVFQHFGHTEQFKIYEVSGKEIVSSALLPAGGSGHGALAGFLRAADVEILLCGGIGGGAKTALADAGILLYGGVTGGADAAVRAYLDGTLRYNPDVQCSHHGEDHGEHSCGGHDCAGGHGCGGHHHGIF